MTTFGHKILGTAGFVFLVNWVMGISLFFPNWTWVLAEESLPPLEAGFVRLDNGRDLEGWYPVRFWGIPSDDYSGWSVVDGAIHLECAQARFNLFSKHKFSRNCIIRLQYRASRGADSGVFIHGNQFQVRDYPHSYPDTQRYAPYAKPHDQWNELEFDITEGIAVVRLNGHVIEKKWRIGDRPDLGLGLQREVGNFDFRFIRVAEKEELKKLGQ